MSNFTQRVKRALTYTVAGTTIAWSVGLASLPVALGANPGDLLKTKCPAGAGADHPCRAVWYLSSDNKLRVFTDAKTYFTWYSDFTGVKEVSSQELAAFPIGGNVTARPGVKMVKVPTHPTVYLVASGGMLKAIASEDVAKALYGNNWAKEVFDILIGSFINYKVDTEADGTTPKYVSAAAQYDRAAQTAASPTITADLGLAGGGTTPPPSDGGAAAGSTLRVELAADTPASGIVVENSIRVPFTIVNFTASSDGDVTVDSLVVERAGGASQDGAFSGVLLWDADTNNRISNTSRTLSSVHQASFNEDIVVKAGTTRKVIIAGNMISSLDSYAGETPTLGIRSIVLKGSTTLTGAQLPLFGNYQTLNGTVTIGTLTITTGANNPSSSTQKIGTTDFIFAGLRFTAGSAEDVEVTRVVFNQGGTAADTDVTNLDLLLDGTVIATVAQADNKDVAFDLRANPITLAKGKSTQVDLRGDIVAGSARTIRWDIKKQDDVIAKGKTYGFSPTPTYNNTTEPYHNQGGTITINRGTVQISPTSGTLNSNVAEDTKEVLLGRFDFDVRGESVSFERVGLQFLLATSTDSAQPNDITNVKLVDKSGAVLAGPVDASNAHYDETTSAADRMGAATITDVFILPAGVHTIEVRGDLNADFSANDTIRAQITPKANITAKGVDTGETLAAADKEPSTVQQSAIYTVKTAALAVSVMNSPVAQNVVGGTQNFVFAQFRLDASDSGEDVKMTQLKSELFTATAVPLDFSNWRVMDGDTTLQTSSSADPTGATAGGATTTFVFVNPMIVTKGTVKVIKVLANISTSASSGSIRVGLPTPHATGSQFSATGKSSGQTATVSLSVGDGQTMTLQSAGTLTIAAYTQNHPAGLLPASTNGVEVGIFRMTSVRENIKVEKLYLTATSTRTRTAAQTASGFNQIRAIHLYDGATRLTPEGGVQPTTTSYTETGASGASSNATVLIDVTSNPIVVPTDRALDISVKVDTQAVTRYPQASTGAPGQGFVLSINAVGDVTAKGSQSGTTLAAGSKTLSGNAFNAWTVMNNVPIVTVYNDLPTSDKIGGSATLPKLTAGTQKELYKFKVVAESGPGDVYLQQVTLAFDQQKATVTNPFIIRADSGSQVAATTTSPVTHIITSSRLLAAFNFWFSSDGLAPTNTTHSPQQLSPGSSRLFTVKGDVACWTDNGCGTTNPSGSLQVSFLGDTAFPTTYPDSSVTLYNPGANTNKFVWSDASIIGPLGVASGTATTSEQWFNGFRVRSAVSSIGRIQATTTDVTWNP